MTEKAAERDYAKSILFLSQCLETYYGKKQLLLLMSMMSPWKIRLPVGFIRK